MFKLFFILIEYFQSIAYSFLPGFFFKIDIVPASHAWLLCQHTIMFSRVLVIIKTSANCFCRDSSCYAVCRDILGDDRASRNDGTLTNMNTCHNYNTGADPYVIPDYCNRDQQCPVRKLQTVLKEC